MHTEGKIAKLSNFHMVLNGQSESHNMMSYKKRQTHLLFPSKLTVTSVSSSCFVLHTSMIYCLKSFSQVQICHLLTSSSFSLPMLCRWTLVQLIMMGDIERRVTLPFPSLYDSLTRFPLSSVPHVSAPAEDSADPRGPRPLPCRTPARHQTDR